MWQGYDEYSVFILQEKETQKRLTSIHSSCTNSLIRKTNIQWHLPPEIIELLAGLPLGDLKSFAELVIEPGKPATHRGSILEVRIAKSLDLALVLDRLLLLDVAREDGVPRGTADERHGIWSVRADDNLALAPPLVPQVGPHVRVRSQRHVAIVQVLLHLGGDLIQVDEEHRLVLRNEQVCREHRVVRHV